MKLPVRAPFFEIGIKNYIFGDDVLRAAQQADAAAEKYDIDVMMIVPYTEIRRVSEHTKRLVVVAPYMDLLRPGRGVADILPEAIKAAGARGVVINHCERPMTFDRIRATIERAREIGLFSFVCADGFEQMEQIAGLNPEIMNPEMSSLIGSGRGTEPEYVSKSIEIIKNVNPRILVEQASGISAPQEVYELIRQGAEGVGVSSGIFKSPQPLQMIDAMIAAVREAVNDCRSEKRN